MVLRVDAKVCHVQVDGKPYALPLRGKLFEPPLSEAQPVVAGDHVQVRRDGDGGAIEARLPRSSKLGRARPGEAQERVIAANVDLVVAVAALAEPPLQSDLVDRILAGAEREKIPALLVLTKLDLDRHGAAARWTEIYQRVGYPVLAVCVAEPESAALQQVRDRMRGATSVLCGASGVGKSSLINALCPGLQLKVGSMSRIRQGKHTTSHTSLLPLPFGGFVLDTPGVRGFGLHCCGAQELQFAFRELVPLVGRCEYRNCLHASEPGCAVRAAIAAGAVAESRYASYAALVRECATSGER